MLLVTPLSLLLLLPTLLGSLPTVAARPLALTAPSPIHPIVPTTTLLAPTPPQPVAAALAAAKKSGTTPGAVVDTAGPLQVDQVELEARADAGGQQQPVAGPSAGSSAPAGAGGSAPAAPPPAAPPAVKVRCDYCTKSFVPRYMRTHLERCPVNLARFSFTRLPLTEETRKLKQEKRPVRCRRCNHAFPDVRSLLAHGTQCNQPGVYQDLPPLAPAPAPAPTPSSLPRRKGGAAASKAAEAASKGKKNLNTKAKLSQAAKKNLASTRTQKSTTKPKAARPPAKFARKAPTPALAGRRAASKSKKGKGKA